MSESPKIQGRPLSDRFAPWSGYPVETKWNFHDAMYELESLLDCLFDSWGDAQDAHLANRIFAVYHGARRLCQDIADVHDHELKMARAQGDAEPEGPAEDGEEAAQIDESNLSPADLQ